MSDYPHVDMAIEAIAPGAFLGVKLTVIASLSTIGLLIAIIIHTGMTAAGLVAVYNAFENESVALTIFSGLQVVFVLCAAFGGLNEIMGGGVMPGMLLDMFAIFSA